VPWLVALLAPAQAQVRTWVGSFVGDWDNNARWNPGFEPTAADDAFINNGGTALVTTSGDTARNLTLGGPTGSGTVTIFAPGLLTVNSTVSSSIILGPSTGSLGTLSIGAGGGATAQNLIVGQSGIGMLVVQNGGTLTDIGGFVGSLSGSQGTVTVSGPGSTWNSADIVVGGMGTGTLIIQNGGTVISSAGGGSIGMLPARLVR
jgi:T5SS/PEP-CTERM-associated repeat protein